MKSRALFTHGMMCETMPATTSSNAERRIVSDGWNSRCMHRLPDARRPDLAQQQRGWTYCTSATIVAPLLSSPEPALPPPGREGVREKVIEGGFHAMPFLYNRSGYTGFWGD